MGAHGSAFVEELMAEHDNDNEGNGSNSCGRCLFPRFCYIKHKSISG